MTDSTVEDIPQLDFDQRLEFKRAIREGDENKLTALIDQHGLAAVNACGATFDVESPLFSTIRVGAVGVLDFLFKKGVSVHQRSAKSKTTLLIEAAKHGSCEMMAFLLERGARINDMDKHGTTALYHAVARTNGQDVVALLLKHGADMELTQDSLGWTPLCRLVTSTNDPAHVTQLLEAGASIDVRTNTGATLAELAGGMKHMAIVELLAAWEHKGVQAVVRGHMRHLAPFRVPVTLKRKAKG